MNGVHQSFVIQNNNAFSGGDIDFVGNISNIPSLNQQQQQQQTMINHGKNNNINSCQSQCQQISIKQDDSQKYKFPNITGLPPTVNITTTDFNMNKIIVTDVTKQMNHIQNIKNISNINMTMDEKYKINNNRQPNNHHNNKKSNRGRKKIDRSEFLNVQGTMFNVYYFSFLSFIR